MARSKNEWESKFSGNVGWLLALALVASTSFLIGSSLKPKSAVVSDTSASSSNPGSVVSDISNSLSNSTPATDTATPTDLLPTAPVSGIVNINTGGETELESLPGIGPSKAKAIIDYRNSNGPFIRIEDIEKVKGIGPKTFDSLKSKITI